MRRKSEDNSSDKIRKHQSESKLAVMCCGSRQNQEIILAQ